VQLGQAVNGALRKLILASSGSKLVRRFAAKYGLRLGASRFVAGETLANVLKHANASRVTIEVTRRDGAVAVEVADDGVGGADPGGAGLCGLRDRVEALDGRLRVESPSGGGTRVTAAIPCA